MYVSPVALVYNLSGVKTLNLDGPTLAKIFSGKVTKWNDPAIAALNKGVTLPSSNITPVYRSDKSGTTNNFTDYLHQTAPSVWTQAAADAFPYKTGEGAAKGSGVVAAVTSGKGTIGYVDNSSAGTLSVAKIKVGSSYVAPSAAVASKTAETSPLDPGPHRQRRGRQARPHRHRPVDLPDHAGELLHRLPAVPGPGQGRARQGVRAPT